MGPQSQCSQYFECGFILNLKMLVCKKQDWIDVLIVRFFLPSLSEKTDKITVIQNYAV